MNKNKEGFKDIKERYLHKDLLHDIEHDYGKQALSDYIENIKGIEEDKEYNIFGYGSLMNYSDAKRSFKNIKAFAPYTIENFGRVFNLGYIGKYLNVKHYIGGEVAGVKITILAEDMLAFILREVAYKLNVINLRDESIYIVIASGTSISGEPILSYVSLCMQGAKDLGGYEYVENLLQAEVYNGQSLKEWLDNLDLVNYLIRNDHVSR